MPKLAQILEQSRVRGRHLYRSFFFSDHCIKQIDFMLPWVCSVIDHRGRQNVVKTSVTHSACGSCATSLFLPHFDVICDLLLNRGTATWNLFVKQFFFNNVGKVIQFTAIAPTRDQAPRWGKMGGPIPWLSLQPWVSLCARNFSHLVWGEWRGRRDTLDPLSSLRSLVPSFKCTCLQDKVSQLYEGHQYEVLQSRLHESQRARTN